MGLKLPEWLKDAGSCPLRLLGMSSIVCALFQAYGCYVVGAWRFVRASSSV